MYRDCTNLSIEIIDNMFLLDVTIALVDCKIDRMDWRVQQPCKFVEAKESVYMKKELNSHRIGLEHRHAGCRDVMCIRSITCTWYRVALNFCGF